MKATFAAISLGSLALLGGLLTPATASAQNYYSAGKVSLSVERVFGIHHVSNHYDPDVGLDSEWSGTSLGFGWQGALTPLHWARAGLDGFVTDRLSLGGAIGFYTQSGDRHDDGFLIAPRVGYVVPISRVFSFWPRGGVSFAANGDSSLFALTGEAMFLASPAPNWGILFGPTLDLALIGHDGPNTDWTQIAFSFPTVGLTATF